jgi:hypothetical protein
MPELRDPMPKRRKKPTDGAKLGTGYRTEPDPTSKVTDHDALCKPSKPTRTTSSTSTTSSGRTSRSFAVLAEHATELLARIERVKARGSLAARPDRNAGQAVERLVQAGVMDGRPRRSGQAADESELHGDKPRPRERSAAA